MCLYEAQISGEHLQGHWSSGFVLFGLLFYVHGKQLRSCRDGQLS